MNSIDTATQQVAPRPDLHRGGHHGQPKGLTATKRHLGAALAVAVLTAASVALAAVPAHADPVGQCPPGWLTASADFGPQTAALDAAGNQDGYVCRLLFRAGANLGFANIVDNNIPLHVTF
jgi:hypothetical protein